MGTVKYSGPIASFRCPTEAEIRSLKVHFSPKQEGTGDPSPENVREIVGWDGVEVYNWTSANASTSSVPSEYKKVEYLEGTDASYIATNYVPDTTSDSLKFTAMVEFTSYYSGDRMIFGSQPGRSAQSGRLQLELYNFANARSGSYYTRCGKAGYINVCNG